MPLANLDLVRSIFTAWERGEYGRAEWAHPDIEFVIADGPSPGRWTGLAGMAEGFREEVLGAFQDTRAEADEYRELDDGRVLVLYRRSGRGKTSGLEIAQIRSKGAVLYDLRGGTVTRLAFYWDREHALADLGLATEGEGEGEGDPDSALAVTVGAELSSRRPAPKVASSGRVHSSVLAELEPRQAELLELVRDHASGVLG